MPPPNRLLLLLLPAKVLLVVVDVEDCLAGMVAEAAASLGVPEEGLAPLAGFQRRVRRASASRASWLCASAWEAAPLGNCLPH